MNYISHGPNMPTLRELILRVKLDMRKDCQLRCLDFVEVWRYRGVHSKGVHVDRTVDALALFSCDNGRGT